MPFERVQRKNGTWTTVSAGSEKELKDAVKVLKNEEAPVYPNINHPVQKGHDLVAVDGDLNKVRVNGEGAHNSPYNAIDDNGNETGDPEVTAAGLEEPAYKQVAGGSDQGVAFIEPTKAEVKAAQADSKPAEEVTPEPAKEK